MRKNIDLRALCKLDVAARPVLFRRFYHLARSSGKPLGAFANIL